MHAPPGDRPGLAGPDRRFKPVRRRSDGLSRSLGEVQRSRRDLRAHSLSAANSPLPSSSCLSTSVSPLLRAPRPSAAAPCGSGRSLCSGPVRLLGSGGVLQCCEPRTTRGGSVWWPRRALRQRRCRTALPPPAAHLTTPEASRRGTFDGCIDEALARRRPLRRPRSQHAHARHVQRHVLRGGVQRHVLRRARVLVVLPPYVLPHRSCAAAAERPP